MDDQLSLFSGGEGGKRSIDERFAEFDRANPAVWQAFVRHARKLIARGHKHYSADAILHVIRYDYAVHTAANDGYKINNDFTSRYARKFAVSYPEHAEFFQQRRLTA